LEDRGRGAQSTPIADIADIAVIAVIAGIGKAGLGRDKLSVSRQGCTSEPYAILG